MDPLTIAAIAGLAEIGIGLGSKLYDAFTTSEDERRARQYGSRADLLQRSLQRNVMRRLAGQASPAARELARQAEANQIRQTEMARAQIARTAQARGIGGTGVALANERLTMQGGIRAASAARAGVELADIRGAENEALNLSRIYAAEAQAARQREIARETAWTNLMGSGANLLGQLYGMKYFAQMYGGQPTAANTPGATAAQPNPWPLSFPETGVWNPSPAPSGYALRYPGLEQWPSYELPAARYFPPRTLSAPLGLTGPPQYGMDFSAALRDAGLF